MNIINKPEYKEAFLQLPSFLQETLQKEDIQQSLRKLASKYKLHYDKWTVLEDEIWKSLLGITEVDKLADNIEKHVGINHDMAIQIADDVALIVFDPVQQELKETVGEALSTLEILEHESGADYSKNDRKPKIDISKFTQTPTNPEEYTPKAKPNDYIDPYQEPIE